MSNIDKIAALEREIEGLNINLNGPGTSLEERISLMNLISSTRNQLTSLQNQTLVSPAPVFSFDQLLRRAGISNLNPHVVSRCRARFGSLVVQAVNEQSPAIAHQAYQQTLDLPQTQTIQQFLVDGFQLDGPWLSGNEKFTICFNSELQPHVLKSLTSHEFTRGQTFFDLIGDRGLDEYHVAPFQIKTVHGSPFMIMPLYSVTLEHISKLTTEHAHRLYVEMKSAILFIHELGLNHMDIKPSNICVRSDGSFVLIDFGSIVRKLEYSESTVPYLPRDFQARDRRNPSHRYQAIDVNDWLMLAMTIAEKLFELPVGGSIPPPTIDELKSFFLKLPQFAELLSKF